MTDLTFKGTITHTNKKFLHSGIAPDFILVDKDLQNRSLKDFSGYKLISTNPSLDTSVCAKTAMQMNTLAKKFPKLITLVVTKDLPFAQLRFCTSKHIENIHPLSMMRSDDFGKDYGILLIDGPLEGLLARSIYLINQENQIIYAELVKEITEEPTYEKLEKILEKNM